MAFRSEADTKLPIQCFLSLGCMGAALGCCVAAVTLHMYGIAYVVVLEVQLSQQQLCHSSSMSNSCTLNSCDTAVFVTEAAVGSKVWCIVLPSEWWQQHARGLIRYVYI